MVVTSDPLPEAREPVTFASVAEMAVFGDALEATEPVMLASVAVIAKVADAPAAPASVLKLSTWVVWRFLSQPFHVAEVFTGSPGKYVSLKETIRGFKGIINGEYDHLPEQAFYMVGGIDEAVEKAAKMN